MKKSKTKNRTKRKSAKRHQQYPVHYLAIILIVFLLLQGFLISATQITHWQTGVSLLDVRQEVALVAADLMKVFQPALDLYHNVHTFSQLAATETIALLADTNPIGEVVSVASGIDEFYAQASIQMAKMLDVSELAQRSGLVAGISI